MEVASGPTGPAPHEPIVGSFERRDGTVWYTAPIRAGEATAHHFFDEVARIHEELAKEERVFHLVVDTRPLEDLDPRARRIAYKRVRSVRPDRVALIGDRTFHRILFNFFSHLVHMEARYVATEEEAVEAIQGGPEDG